MGKSREEKMLTAFDKICKEIRKKTGGITYADLSNHIKEKIATMETEKTKWVKIELKRKKEHAKTLQNVFTTVYIPLTVLFFTSEFKELNSIGRALIFSVLCIGLAGLIIRYSNKAEQFGELIDLIEKKDTTSAS